MVGVGRRGPTRHAGLGGPALREDTGLGGPALQYLALWASAEGESSSMSRTTSIGFIATLGLTLLAPATAWAGNPIAVTPYPVAAGQSVTIQYDPTGRVLDGAGQVYLHYGFNNWATVVSPDPAMGWNAGASAWEATVAVPTNAYQLDFVFHNGSGTWDNNGGADWHLLVMGSASWDVDGQLDDDAILIAENNGYPLYAGVRGTILYVAAPGASSGNDHFIFVADTPGSPAPAPWEKRGPAP